MRVGNTDAPKYQKKEPEKCLHEAERGKKKMYLEACLQQRWHFSPFVSSVDGLLRVEATATLKRIASRLATKWKQSYSETCGYVKSRVAITLVRTTHRCIRGSRVPAHRISMQRPQWEDGADSTYLGKHFSRKPTCPSSPSNKQKTKNKTSDTPFQ